MRVVIEIPTEIIRYCKNRCTPTDCEMFARKIIEDIANGKPLPEGHGRLIDADALIAKVEDLGVCNGVSEGAIDNAPTIIEAEKETDYGKEIQ